MSLREKKVDISPLQISTAPFTKEEYQFILMENLAYRFLKPTATIFTILLNPAPLKSALNHLVQCSHRVQYLICLCLFAASSDCFRSLQLSKHPCFVTQVVLSIMNQYSTHYLFLQSTIQWGLHLKTLIRSVINSKVTVQFSL